MPDLNIEIVTTAKGDGAKQAAQGIGQVTDAAKQSKPAQEAAAQAAEKHAHSHRELHIAAHSLAGQFPHLTSLLWAFRSPLVAGALAIGIFIEKIRELWEEQKKLAEGAAADASALTIFTFAANNAKTKSAEMTTAAGQLAAALGQVNQQSRDAQKVIDAEINKIEAKLNLEKQVLDNKEKQSIAELELKRVREGMSDAEFERSKGGIQGFFAGLRGNLEGGAAGEKQNVLAQAHMKAIQDQKNALAAELALREDEQRAKDRLKEFDRQEAEASKRRAKLMQEAQEEEAKAQLAIQPWEQTVRQFGADFRAVPGARTAGEGLAMAQERVARAQAAQRSIFGTGNERQGQRDLLAADLARTSGFRQDAISAAAKSGGLAESTRTGVVTSMQSQALAVEAAKNTAATEKTLAELRAQQAMEKERAELEKERTRLIEEQLRDLKAYIKRSNGQ